MTKITELVDATLPLDPTDLVEVVQQVGSTPINTKAPLSAVGGSGGGGLLGAVSYQSATNIDITPTTTAADVDATNLVITFTVPASGRVLVTLAALCWGTGGGNSYQWGVREGTTNIVIPVHAKESASTDATSRLFLITGLTPGAAKTYKWSHRVTAGSAAIRTGPDWGPCVMQVLAA